MAVLPSENRADRMKAPGDRLQARNSSSEKFRTGKSMMEEQESYVKNYLCPV